MTDTQSTAQQEAMPDLPSRGARRPVVGMIVRPLLFLAILAILVVGTQRIFAAGPFGDTEEIERDTIVDFYEERPGALDAVYVGASNVYSFWQGPLAWERHGIAVHSVSASAMPASFLKYMIIECRKTQPDALYIVNVGNFKSEESRIGYFHHTADFMPLSLNKVRMVLDAGDHAGLDNQNKLGLLFPILSLHTTWSELETEDFEPVYASVKGGSVFPKLFSKTNDVSETFANPPVPEQLDDVPDSSIGDLLDYCDESGVKILFVYQPQAIVSGEVLGRFDWTIAQIRARGYDVLDISQSLDELGLDPAIDYADKLHTNAHGTIKYTDYLARYLVEHYGFADKRGDEAYGDWDEAAARYRAYLGAQTILPWEFDLAACDTSLRVPELSTTYDAAGIHVRWAAAEGASSYEVYRRQLVGARANVRASRAGAQTTPSMSNLRLGPTDEGLDTYQWKLVTTVDGATLAYDDTEELPRDTCYEYVVIPVLSDGTRGSYVPLYSIALIPKEEVVEGGDAA